MLYMLIERFKDGDPVPVYMTTCYQMMECEERRLLDQWIAAGSDLVDFEVIPVMTSAEAVQRIAPRL
jgi:uncharacterized protein DUF3303